MEFNTNCVAQLSALFTTLKRFGDFDEPLHFTPKGIEYTALIEYGNGVVQWQLNAKNLTTRNYDVMPDIEMMSQCLNTKGWTQVKWRLHGENPESLLITLIDNVHSRECSVPLLHWEPKAQPALEALLSEWRWPDCVVLPSDKLKKMVTELNSLGANAVEIGYNPGLCLAIGGETSGNKRITDEYTPNEVIKFQCTAPASRTGFRSFYSLKTLLPIVKISKAVKYVKIYPAFPAQIVRPLLLEYDLDTIGLVRFYIAPRADEKLIDE